MLSRVFYIGTYPLVQLGSNLCNCYKSLVRLILEYAAVVWAPHTLSAITSIEKIQRHATRFICGDYSRYSSVTEMLQSLSLWNAIVDKNPIVSMHIYIYIVQFLIFNSTLTCPIQQTKFLFNICFNSQLFNSLVQILFQYSLQLSIVQLTSPNLCPIYTSTLNCPTH